MNGPLIFEVRRQEGEGDVHTGQPGLQVELEPPALTGRIDLGHVEHRVVQRPRSPLIEVLALEAGQKLVHIEVVDHHGVVGELFEARRPERGFGQAGVAGDERDHVRFHDEMAQQELAAVAAHEP